MAQRFGGKYSPDGSSGPDERTASRPATSPYDGAQPSAVGARVNLLFLAPLLMAWRAFRAEPVVMAQWLVALGLLLLAAWLTREGLKAQEAYEARTIAKRPAIPRKIFGSVLMGAGLGMAGLAGHGPVEAVIFFVLGAALHFLSFGPDPLRDKGAEGIDQFQQDRVARVVDEAEKHLRAMTTAAEGLRDHVVERRVAEFQATARKMFRTVEEDPRDLAGARKFLGVYLMGARDATLKFADLYAKEPRRDDRQQFLDLLDDLDGNFAAKTEKLMNDNRTDMDIEIKVLRDRLAREGVVPASDEGI